MPQARNIYSRLLTSPFLVSLTKGTSQGPQAWKMEYIPANKMSIAWQLPQYALFTAGEIMFSVTGLEFSYSQVGFCKWKVEVELLLRGWSFNPDTVLISHVTMAKISIILGLRFLTILSRESAWPPGTWQAGSMLFGIQKGIFKH